MLSYKICYGSILGVYAAVVYGPKRAFITTWFNIPISLWILIVTTILEIVVLKIKTLHQHGGFQ